MYRARGRVARRFVRRRFGLDGAGVHPAGVQVKTYEGRTPRRILEHLREQPEPSSAREIAAALGATYGAVIDALTLLAHGGAISRHGPRNRYRYTIKKEPTP